MEEKIIDLYVNQGLVANKVAKKLGISTDEVLEVLKDNHYMAHGSRKREWVISAKKAIDYYIENKKCSVNEAARMFKITNDSLSRLLKELGYNPMDRVIKDFDETLFDSIDTEEKAYWLGFLMADGSIDSSPLDPDKKSHYSIRLQLALIDTGHLFKFDKFTGVEKSRVKVYDTKDSQNNPKQICLWTTASKTMWESLVKLGCTPKKSLTLVYPKIPKELKRHFARGYFDGDGSFGIYGTKTFGELNLSCVGTNDILKNLYSELNMDIKIYHHTDHASETLTLSANTHKAKKILDYMYKDSTIYLDRKFNKYLEVCRFWKKFQKESQGNIGEGCDANTEIIEEIKEFSTS